MKRENIEMIERFIASAQKIAIHFLQNLKHETLHSCILKTFHGSNQRGDSGVYSIVLMKKFSMGCIVYTRQADTWHLMSRA